MTFRKYNSIENTYREKFINEALESNPVIASMEFEIQEKIHGANIQVFFEKGKPWRVGKRTSFIFTKGQKEQHPEQHGFYGINPIIKRYASSFDSIAADLEKQLSSVVSITYFGEYAGHGIQKEIDYGSKDLYFFDIFIEKEDGTVIKGNLEICEVYDLKTVPILSKVSSLKEALEFDIDFDSKILNKENNLCEGIVAKPSGNELVYDKYGSLFYLKKKNERFLEFKKPKNQPKAEPNPLNIEFRNYITPQRVSNVESKNGPIENPSQFALYIKLVLDDAKVDFLKDHPEVEKMNKKEQRSIFNVGSEIVKLLKEKV